MPPPRRSNPLVKLAIGAAVLALVAVLFVRSLDDARAEPFLIRPQHLVGWTLAEVPGAKGELPALILAPPPEMPMRLFRQVFTRAGESLSTPLQPGLALVLADELRGAPLGSADLAALAREAGIDRAAVSLACMGYRRDSQPAGGTRQVYFISFDMPEFARFRRLLADRLAAAGHTGFQPDALSPVMLLAGQPDVLGWMPIVVNAASDCVAPFETETS